MPARCVLVVAFFWVVDFCVLIWQKGLQTSLSLFDKGTNHFPKVPSLNAITQNIRISTDELAGDMNILSTALWKSAIIAQAVKETDRRGENTLMLTNHTVLMNFTSL